MKTKLYILALSFITLVICTAGLWGSIKKGVGKVGGVISGAVGKVTGVTGAVGNFVGETAFGGVIGGAFGPAIDKYDASNQKSIATLDTTLNRRLRQFNDILVKRENQLDTILTARENQLDEIFKTSILQVDEKIKEDLDKLDENLEFRIGQLNTGLTVNSFVFTSSLWIVFKGVAQLGLILILTYFILSTISRFINRGLNKNEKKEIVHRAKIYGIVVAVGLILTIFFNPISNSFINPELKKTVESNEKNLTNAANEYDYKKATYSAYILTQLEIGDETYEYNKIKYDLLKDLMYRPKYAIFNSQNIDELVNKMDDFESAFTRSGSKDPEFYTINGMYVLYTFNNREGEALASYMCTKSLTDREKNEKFPLDIFAYNVIKNFKTHPMPQEEITNIVKKYGFEKVGNKVLEPDKIIINDSLLFSSVKFASTFVYDSLLINVTKKDEQDFIHFLESEKNGDNADLLITGNKVINRWLDLIDELKKLNARQTKFASLEINDSYVRYIENYFIEKNISLGNDRYNKFIAEIGLLITNTLQEAPTNETQEAIQNINKGFSTFRRYSLCDVLSFFSAKPKVAVISSELGRANEIYNVTKKFAIKYIEYLKNDGNIAIYPEMIDLSSQMGIYQYGSAKTQPLCQDLLALFKSKVPSSNQKTIDAIVSNMNRNLLFTSIKFL